MKKKYIIIICVIMAIVLVLGIAWNILSDYSYTLRANWNFELPFFSRYTEVYEKDSGSSFNGDGIRFHVFSYKYEDYIDLMFTWRHMEDVTVFGESYSEAAAEWLAEIDVEDEWYPDYENCLYWYRSQEDNSQLLIFWDQEMNLLYILESFR